MEKKINNILFITTQDGKRMTFRVLFTYYSEKFKKDYAAFYNEEDENHLIAYSFDEEYNLTPVNTPEEYEELNMMLQKYDAEQASKN